MVRCILLAAAIGDRLGHVDSRHTSFIPWQLEINSLGDDISRQNYRNALKDYLSSYSDGLSEDSVRR